MLGYSKIYQLIEDQCYDNKVAISYLGRDLSYKEFNSTANQLAHYLIKLGVEPGEIVVLVADKSFNTLITILAILKIGAVYVPVSELAPQNIINSILNDTNTKYVFANLSAHKCLTSDFRYLLELDNLAKYVIDQPDQNIPNQYHESNNAYVIYTSGTTGTPKGVIVTHRNLLDTYHSWKTSYNLSKDDVHLQMANPGFDVFTGDWVRALCTGSKLVICPKEELLQPKKLYNTLVNEKINCAEFVPAVLRQLMDYVQKTGLNLSQFRLLIFGSDQSTMEEYRLFKKLSGNNTRVINSYGLTEATIDSSFFEETSQTSYIESSSITPIGKPFPHVEIHILNDQLKPVEKDEIGEIVIGGRGVASGYLNQPEMTQERFHTIPSISLNRLYRTGDKGKYLSDGNIMFLGRNETQIKIDGHRIEIPAIEYIINQHPKVKQCIITATYTAEKKMSLQCYLLLSDSSIKHREIMHHLKGYLSSSLPSIRFYEIESIVLTLNGKINKSPSAQKIIAEIQPEIKSPRDLIEMQLTSIWQRTLNISKIGIDNDFYDVGGSSLLYVSMIERIIKELNIQIPLNFCGTTIKQLSEHIRYNKHGNSISHRKNQAFHLRDELITN